MPGHIEDQGERLGEHAKAIEFVTFAHHGHGDEIAGRVAKAFRRLLDHAGERLQFRQCRFGNDLRKAGPVTRREIDVQRRLREAALHESLPVSPFAAVALGGV